MLVCSPQLEGHDENRVWWHIPYTPTTWLRRGWLVLMGFMVVTLALGTWTSVQITQSTIEPGWEQIAILNH